MSASRVNLACSPGALYYARAGNGRVCSDRPEQRYGKLVDVSAFRREILPAIQGVPLSRLARATGLSLRYVS